MMFIADVMVIAHGAGLVRVVCWSVAGPGASWPRVRWTFVRNQVQHGRWRSHKKVDVYRAIIGWMGDLL